MNQTFYVEVDEEISSVIDKLRKSLSVENYIVITGRSLVAQSVVNLKLLKRESEKLQKKIVIVTQDEHVAKMVERAGLDIKSSMEGIDLAENNQQISEEISLSDDRGIKKNRLVKVGSEDFHGMKKVEANEAESIDPEAETRRHIKVSENLQSTKSLQGLPSKNLSDLKVPPAQSTVRPQASDMVKKSVPTYNATKPSGRGNYDLKKSFEDFLDPEKEKRLENVLSKHSVGSGSEKIVDLNVSSNKDNSKKDSSNGSRIFNVFLFFILIVAGVAGYLYIPSAKVKVYVENQNREIPLSLDGDISLTEVDIQKKSIPVRILEREEEIMLQYDSTGISESAGQKARGTLVVYNEYSAAAQALVATTRFETEDGKIFRLAKGVLVPGTTIVGQENKPGAIEVEVIADAPGDSYNIEPTTFSIPGFMGGDKYKKIYAKSSKNMSGGNLSGDVINKVSQADVDMAKEKTEAALKEKMENSIKNELEKGEVMLSLTPSFEVLESLAIARVGDAKDTFDYQVKAKEKFIVILEKDVLAVVMAKYNEENKKDFEIVINNVDVKYDKVETDNESGKAKVSVLANISATPDLNLEDFKKEILYKDEKELRIILGKYPFIRNMDISVNPEFMSKLPRFSKRVNIESKEFEASN